MAGFVDSVTWAVDPAGIAGFGNRAPKQQYVGGSKEALDERRSQYEAGRQSGAAQVDTGLGMLGTAAQDARFNAARGDEVYRLGMDTAAQARLDENRALDSLLATAQRRGPSMALAQQEAGLGQLQRAMMARASAVRGGNQAAAQRGANAAGAEAALGLLERQGALRAAEEDAAIQRELAARGLIANARAQQVGRGYGLLGVGLGASGNAVGQMGSFGAEGARIGAGREGAYLGAQAGVDSAQLQADMARETARYGGQQAMTGAMLGTAGGIVGSMYGGPVGGAAGQQVGQNVGGSYPTTYDTSYGGNNYDPNRLGNPR